MLSLADVGFHATPGSSSRTSRLRAVTLLELLARPAPAGFVAPQLLVLVDVALLDVARRLLFLLRAFGRVALGGAAGRRGHRERARLLHAAGVADAAASGR